jgi:protease IV
LKELAAAKPVVVSMGEMAASGGYYVACLGRPILAEAGTITGSIGVFGMKPNLGTLMRRVGIKPELIALDESSSMDALDMNWNDEQKASMQAFVDSIYRRFVQHAATSRNLSEADVLAVAGGRVWSGIQAVQRKLVDRIGGLEEAIQLVKAEAGLGDGVEIQHVPTPKSIFETLASSFGGETSVLVPHAFRTLLKESGDLEAAARLVLDAGLATTPRVYARLPVDLKVR